MYLRKIFKREILGKNFAFFSILTLVLSLGLSLDIFSQSDYSIHIKDNDKSSKSQKLIKNLEEMDGLNLSIEDNKEVTALLQINEGYEEKLENGRLNNLIQVHAEENSKNVKLIEDRLSLEIVKEYIEVDNYKKIRKNKEGYSYEDYQSELRKDKEKNTILSLKIIESGGKEPVNNPMDEIGIAIPILLSFYLAYTSNQKISHLRDRNIIKRLSLSAINEKDIVLAYFISHIIKSLAFMGISSIFFAFRKNLILTALILIVGYYIMLTLCQKIAKNHQGYQILSKTILFISLVLVYAYLYFKILIV